jgi:GxxExxY protein
VYQRALALELQAAGLEFEREVKVPIIYKGHQIDTRRADFVVEDVMVEIKAKSQVAPEDFVQALNYVKASGFKLGLLLNFGASRLQIKRLVNREHETRKDEDAKGVPMPPFALFPLSDLRVSKLLELNPHDNQGVRFLLHDLDKGLSWEESVARDEECLKRPGDDNGRRIERAASGNQV